MTQRTGRKPGYTHDQLGTAIAQADAATPHGGEASIADIRRALLELTGLSGVNELSLGNAVAAFRSEARAANEESLIARLPGDHVAEIDRALVPSRRAMLLAVATVCDRLHAERDAAVARARREASTLSIALRDAQEETAQQADEIARMEKEAISAAARIAELEAAARAADQAYAQLEAQHVALVATFDKLVEALRSSGLGAALASIPEIRGD